MDTILVRKYGEVVVNVYGPFADADAAYEFKDRLVKRLDRVVLAFTAFYVTKLTLHIG